MSKVDAAFNVARSGGGQDKAAERRIEGPSLLNLPLELRQGQASGFAAQLALDPGPFRPTIRPVSSSNSPATGERPENVRAVILCKIRNTRPQRADQVSDAFVRRGQLADSQELAESETDELGARSAHTGRRSLKRLAQAHWQTDRQLLHKVSLRLGA